MGHAARPSSTVSTRTPARGARAPPARSQSRSNEFQLALPRGERGRRRGAGGPPPSFNSHSRAGSESGNAVATAALSTFQLALPRGERARERRDRPPRVLVSTRTPARGASRRVVQARRSQVVSTRTPARGARLPWCVNWPVNTFQLALPRGERAVFPGRVPRISSGFNSHSRAGSERPVGATKPRLAVVSTRTPARGASLLRGFVSRRRVVSTRTPARGASSRHGCVAVLGNLVSTRTPARGASASNGVDLGLERVSTRTPARGASASNGVDLGLERVSTRTPARGASPTALSACLPSPCFNSHSRAGSEGPAVLHGDPPLIVSTRTPARGASRDRGTISAM